MSACELRRFHRPQSEIKLCKYIDFARLCVIIYAYVKVCMHVCMCVCIISERKKALWMNVSTHQPSDAEKYKENKPA